MQSFQATTSERRTRPDDGVSWRAQLIANLNKRRLVAFFCNKGFHAYRLRQQSIREHHKCCLRWPWGKETMALARALVTRYSKSSQGGNRLAGIFRLIPLTAALKITNDIETR